VAQLKRTSWGLNMSSKIWNSAGRRPEVAMDELDPIEFEVTGFEFEYLNLI